MAKKMKKNSHFGDILLVALYPALAVVCLIIAVALFAKFGVNRLYMATGGPSVLDPVEKISAFPGQPEGYIPWYNLGNAAMSRGDYEEAETDYSRALEYGPENGRECPIRINYALAILKEVSDEDFQAALDGDAQKKADVVRHLRSARGVLTEQGCADVSDDQGHSAKAEQLKKEIDEYLKQLGEDPEEQEENQEEQQEETSPSESETDSQQSQDNQKSSREQSLQQQLNEQKSDARKQREDIQEEYRSYGNAPDQESDGSGSQGGGSGSGDYYGKQW